MKEKSTLELLDIVLDKAEGCEEAEIELRLRLTIASADRTISTDPPPDETGGDHPDTPPPTP